MTDLLLINGNVLTMAEDQPRACAVAVEDGLIQAVGEEGELRSLRGRRTEVIDLKGRTLVPGFIDAHLHIRALAESLINLAAVLKAQGECAKAEPLYRQGLTMTRRVHGEEHPALASSLSGLGSLLLKCDRAKEAEARARKRLDECRSAGKVSQIDLLRAEAALRRALLRQKAYGRRRGV